MAHLRIAIIGLAAATVLTACTSSGTHKPNASTPAPSTPAPSTTQPAATQTELPGLSTSAAPWPVPVAATEFKNLLEQFSTASGGPAITSSSSFADYLQYSQRIANACDPFLNGLREGHWPVKAQTTIVTFTRLQQVVCDVELARGQAGNVDQYKGVQSPPPGTDSQLLDLRLKIYSELGI